MKAHRRLRDAVAALVGVATTVISAGQAVPTYSRGVTPAVYGRFDEVLAALDFNGDGRQDVLVGGNRNMASGCSTPEQRPVPPPLHVMVSAGDGTFRDGTAAVIDRDPGSFFNPSWPVSLVSDFNTDGRPDIAVFDFGVECGTYPNHTYVGYPPILLLSTPDGKWRASDALANAILKIHTDLGTPERRANIRVLQAAAGDINNDGQADIWVESCGGQNVCSHFLINNGDGTFTADINRVPASILHSPQPEFWRYWGNALADIDNDGDLDLVMGQLHDHDPTHINETSVVVLNDGQGRFNRLEYRLPLPAPDFAGGFSGVNALAALDFDGDGLKDLILAHHRSSEQGSSGRYLQILMNRGAGQFVDDTLVRMGNQSATTEARSGPYSRDLINQVYRIFSVDVNGDGAPDLVMNSQFPIGSEAPLVYLNDGGGKFTVMDPDIFTSRELFFGESSVPVDLNGDGFVDFVHPDLLAGPDGRYGTGDEVTQLISLTGRL